MFTEADIKPRRGMALVRVEGAFQNTGLIEVPKYVRRRAGDTCTLLKVNTGGIPRMADIQAWEGKRVILDRDASRQELMGNIVVVHADKIAGLVPDHIPMKALVGDLQRCKFCGSALNSGRGVIMQQHPTAPHNMACPRCHKDVNGNLTDPKEIAPVSEDQERLLGQGVPGPRRSGKVTVVRP